MYTVRQLIIRAMLLGVTFGLSATTGAAGTDDRPNLLLIIADDLGYADIGAVGSEIETPNIDSLAASGVLFTQFHTANMCAPTRAMLFSGNNNHVAGMARQDSVGLGGNPFTGPGVPFPSYEASLSDRVVPFPKLLQEAGYHTSLVGKWHLGLKQENSPVSAGFTRSWAMLEGAASHFSNAGMEPGGTRYRMDGVEVDWPEGAYSTALYTDKAIEYVDEALADDHPFLAVVSYTSPHWPLQVPDEYLDLYAGRYEQGYDALRSERFEQLKKAGVISADATFPQRNPNVMPWDELSAEARRIEARKMELYASMVDNLDDHIGRLLSHLESRNELDNTVIVFMGDNGAAGEDMMETPFGGHLRETYTTEYASMGKPGSFISYGPQWAEAGSAPFSRYKGYSRQGGIVAPLIVAGAGVAEAEAPAREFLTVMDLAPTFLELAGVNYPEDAGLSPMLGTSLVDYLAGRKQTVHDAEEVTVMAHWGSAMVRKGDWKLVTPGSPYLGSVIRDAEFELFDLSRDPGETRNLADEEKDKFAEMLGIWRTTRRQLGIIVPQDL